MLESSTAPETESPDPREARAARRLAALERLTTIGMALAEAMLARVADAVSMRMPVDTGAAALEFSRLSRAVRQTLALEAQLDVENAELAARVAAERAERRARAARERKDRIRLQSNRVYAAVGEAILAEVAKTKRGGADLDKAAARTRAKALDKELRERLEDPREEDDLADLPTSTVVARICEALGVAVDWDLWRDAPWAVAEWRAAEPGSPYAPESARSHRRDESIRLSAEPAVADRARAPEGRRARSPPDRAGFDAPHAADSALIGSA